MKISESLEKVKLAIGEVAKRCGRAAEDIQLIIVSKTVAENRILEAYEAGARQFGENKIQELMSKQENLPSEIEWHFIGRLQTNKVKYLLGEFVSKHGKAPLIQSVDRLDLVEEIEKKAHSYNLNKVPCLIQINSSGEASKAGFLPDNVGGFLSNLAKDSVLDIRGLMTIGPLTENSEETRAAFRRVRDLASQFRTDYPQHSWDILSMGMSGDYKIAIEEGSNMIRIGSAIFGEREYQR